MLSPNDSGCFLFATATSRRNFTAEEFEAYKLDQQRSVVEFFSFNLPWLKLAVCIFGILSNILNIVVLTRPTVFNSINILFTSLETVNLVIYTTFFYEFAIYYNKDYGILFSETISLISAISQCVHNTLICISNWLTVMVGVWRFIAITYPFKASIYCNSFRSKLVVGIVCLLSLAMWFFYFFSFECLLYDYKIVNEEGDVMYRIPTRLTGNWRKTGTWPFFKSFYPVVILVSYAVPGILIAIVSIGLIFRLWRARDEREAVRRSSEVVGTDKASSNSADEKRVTVALAAMILMYFLAFLSESITSVMYWFFPQSYIVTLFFTRLAWNRYLVLVCNSLTIFFYCAMSTKLRQTYWQALSGLICKKAPKTLNEYPMEPVLDRRRGMVLASATPTPPSAISGNNAPR